MQRSCKMEYYEKVYPIAQLRKSVFVMKRKEKRLLKRHANAKHPGKIAMGIPWYTITQQRHIEGTGSDEYTPIHAPLAC